MAQERVQWHNTRFQGPIERWSIRDWQVKSNLLRDSLSIHSSSARTRKTTQKLKVRLARGRGKKENHLPICLLLQTPHAPRLTRHKVTYMGLHHMKCILCYSACMCNTNMNIGWPFCDFARPESHLLLCGKIYFSTNRKSFNRTNQSCDWQQLLCQCDLEANTSLSGNMTNHRTSSS